MIKNTDPIGEGNVGVDTHKSFLELEIDFAMKGDDISRFMSGRPIAVVNVRQLSHHSIGVQLTDGADKRHALGVCHTLEVLSYV